MRDENVRDHPCIDVPQLLFVFLFASSRSALSIVQVAIVIYHSVASVLQWTWDYGSHETEMGIVAAMVCPRNGYDVASQDFDTSKHHSSFSAQRVDRNG